MKHYDLLFILLAVCLGGCNKSFTTELTLSTDIISVPSEGGTYTFEVGGKDKAFSQIAGIQNSFVLSDDMETPVGRKLPIWIIGFVS